MKKTAITKAIALATMAVLASGCSVVSVDAGEQAVLIDKPYIFGSGGVRDEPFDTGRSFTWFSTSFELVDIKPTLKDEPFDDLMSADTVPVDFKTSLQVQVTNSVALVKNYGKSWYENNIQRQYQAMVRDEARKYTMNELLTGQDTSAKMEVSVRRQLDEMIKSKKLPFKVTDISIGRAVPNKNVLEQIDQTAAQQQRSKTMMEATKAEEERKKAEKARAEADNAYRNEMNLSPDQFLQLESIKKYSEACVKAGNCSLIFGGNNTAMMLPSSK